MLSNKYFILFLMGVFITAFCYSNKNLILGKLNSISKTVTGVKGAKTQNKTNEVNIKSGKFTGNIQQDLQKNIDSIKDEVGGLNVQEIATSSPQIQKVLNDMKSLEKYPKDQAKDMCKKICDGL